MNPQAIYKAFMEAGTARAEARYEYLQLDGATKSILAQATLAARDIDGVSMTEARDIALASAVYRDHVQEVAKARLAFDLADTKWSATDALFQAQRSVEATSRAADRAAQ